MSQCAKPRDARREWKTAAVLALGFALAATALEPQVASAQAKPAWNTPVPAEFQESWKAFQEMKAKAGKALAALPDWSGIWTGGPGGIKFDPAQPGGPGAGKTTASLTPAYEARYRTKLANIAKGVEWDPLSSCLPAGYPRWLTEPFLREIIVTPKETWWTNEQESETRRIYTDGRGHVPDDEAFPLWEGDSVGFWDGDTLVVHTIRVKPGQYQRADPDYSEQTSTIERLRMINPDTLEDQITVWDPQSLTKPWHVVHTYVRVKTPGARIDMWSCEENNHVVKTDAGASKILLPGEAGYRDPSQLLTGPSAK
jgi:hypothetical protein